MKRLLLLAAIAALFAVPIAAARGGQVATLVPSPTQPIVGNVVTFSGCGYTGKSQVWLEVTGTDGTFVYAYVPTDKNGCFDSSQLNQAYTSPQPYLAWQVANPGTYTIQTAQGGTAKAHQAQLDIIVN